ncbi:glutathione S-transferase T3-like [Beta vulgaris subsp. vulgaris]|uniref:glutathione S-transferase T3-like n=1 Tax=Beta vulgaris subsp. vulgaris TaxID=3555 RepID=UPI00053FE306|nr:glutathione S-transferase T3-like [Beta vulgaris subsp. vulgaris]
MASNHWYKMSADVSKFNGCYIQIKDSHPSGHNDTLVINLAKDLWSSRNKKRKFPYTHSLEILRDQPKWQEFVKKDGGSSKRTKVSAGDAYTSSSSNPDASESSRSVQNMDDRPPGQKAAKAAAKGKGKVNKKKTDEVSEKWEKFQDIQMKKLSLFEERIRVQEFELLCKDTSNMNERTLQNHIQVCES